MRRPLVRLCSALVLLALMGAAFAAPAVHGDGEPLTKARATAEAREALKASYGRRWTRGRDKRLRCEKTEDQVFRCPARWKYRGSSFRRTVLVINRDGTLSVSIFAG